ncbi:MAG: TetR family transcriptional regulator [Acidobacteriota bacterium]
MLTSPHATAGEGARATRDRLLDSAERLFAQHGLAATSVREITAEAGANLAAVNYHFGGKHQLYVESFRRRLGVLREQRIATITETLRRTRGARALETLLRAFAESFLDPLLVAEGGRCLMRMIQREMLDPELPEGMFEGELVGPVRASLAEAVLAIEPDLPADHVRRAVESFIAQLLHLARTLDRAGAARSETAAHIEHIVRFSAAGFRACAHPPGRRARTRRDRG